MPKGVVVTDDVNETNATEKKSGGYEKYVIALVVILLAAGAAYQAFFCSTCYGITQKFVPAEQRTTPQ
jgi:hypothetical protein